MVILQRAKFFLLDILAKRLVLLELAKRDFQQQFVGSYLGVVWAFLQPLLFLLVLYLIFSYGFRAGQASDMPFSVYLVSGMIVWMYFSQTLGTMTGVIRGHSFLISKVDFRLSILPIVKILSGMLPHLFFIGVAIAIAWWHGFTPSLFTIQVFYYLIATVCLLLGLGWLTSSTNLFVSDVAKVVAVILQFGFWMTPIFWNITMVPQRYHWIVKLNPVHYLVQGYRDSLVAQVPFWHHYYQGIYFWLMTAFILLAGIGVFGKLRPHFAEVV